MIATVSLAGITIAGLDALLVHLGRAEATALKRSVGLTLTVAYVALVAQTIQRAHRDLGVDVGGTGRVDRIARALQALRAMLREDLTIATGHKGADHALQLVGTLAICIAIQITRTAANGVAICAVSYRNQFSSSHTSTSHR